MTNPMLEAKISDIHSWWEVPCIAHFCSLFRASFNLIDFDIEDLEEALLTDDASDSGNTLIQELIVRLLRGYYGNNSISTFNYQMFLRRLFRQKCREFDCYNPFDNDMDFQFLPMRTKVEILHMLCDFRLDADDVLDILKDLDSDSLRVHPLGYDANKSAYWYFYGTRLYREDYPKKKKEKEKKRGRKKNRGRNKEGESEDEEVELGSGVWQVVCFTESDWERLALNTEDATDKNEQALHQIIEEDFLPEIPKLFQEKERLQRKRFLELHPRKSSRIENLKRRKEEEMQYLEKYKRAFITEGSESEADSENSVKKSANARHERWKNRSNQKEELYYSEENENSDNESSVRSCNTLTGGFIVGRGRQTNNSLSSAAGEIIIHSTEKNHSPEWFDTKLEDLHISMYKVLNKLKEHEDSWPFLEPVDEDDAPDYYKVVKTPMSLQHMEDKLDSGKYKTLAEFKQDFRLMLANCKQYNGSRNEFTEMGENLEKVFRIYINRYISQINSSEGEDVTENSEFQEVMDPHKKRKHRRRKRTNSKNTEDADKENERKNLTADAYSINSLDNETRNAEDTLSMESRIGEHKTVKRGKGRPPKNASAFDALDIVTEQTLRDINKWLDDTPKYTDFCSASNSPPPLISPHSEAAVEISAMTSEVTPVPKSIVRPHKPKDPTKKRPIKENHHKHLQAIKQRRRDIQRTIDRLQPGKSKGNLISTISKSQTNKSNGTDELSSSAKTKETVGKMDNQYRPKPMLSLGSVLSTDIINLDINAKKHTFSDNDSLPSEDEDPFSENEDAAGDQNELQAENLALHKNYTDNLHRNIEEKKPEEKEQEEIIKTESSSNAPEISKPAASASGEKSDKPKPNVGAWLKAFGVPRAQQPLKRKVDSSQFNDNPVTPLPNEEIRDDFTMAQNRMTTKLLEYDRYDINEPPPPTPGRFFLYEDEKDLKNMNTSLPSPDMKPMKRQRKLSTGSSMSERSSFSQDPNDPLNSPHPSLDESVYQSPQPYHHSPIHNATALKVGFYQDTFPRCGSDKSNSCSPREPMNSISPQHPMFSPRDSIISSPRDSVASPRSDPVVSPREVNNLSMSSPRNGFASVSPRDIYAESIRSPFAKSPVYTPTTGVPAVNDITYRTFKPTTLQTTTDKPFSIYPVKKRISAELEQSSRQHGNQEEKVKERSFVSPPVSHEPERHYNTPPVGLPQHMLPSNSYTTEDTSISMSLSHHPTYVDAYPAPDSMLVNPYFRKDLYSHRQGISPPVSSQSSLFMQQGGDSLPAHTQSYYSPPRQPSPLVSGTFSRPLDFTGGPVSSPIPLTSKPNENFASQYHSKYEMPPADSALNFSNKSQQHSFYPVESEHKMENEYQRSKLDSPLQAYDTRTPENVYHHNVVDLKHNYRSTSSPFVNTPGDYFNGSKSSPNYPISDLRFVGMSTSSERSPAVLDDKQYFQPMQSSSSSIDSSYAPKSNRYDISYQTPQAAAAPAKSAKKSKSKKKATVTAQQVDPPPHSEVSQSNPSIYPHYLTSSGHQQPNVQTSQDLKHNGMMSNAFNFGAPATLKNDYQQYFDNLRNSRYFADSAAVAAANEKTPNCTATPPVSNTGSFQFLQRGSPSSFSLAAQAFMTASGPPCPPSIYSSPYLQRPPDELLRPMMLQQGLMSAAAAHGGGYPHGYLNMHDPRSPWL